MTKAILSILFIGASVLVFVLYVQPTYDDIQRNRATVAQFDSALERTREIQTLKESLLNRYNVFVGENLDRLQKMLPDHVDNVRLVLDLDGIASRYGLRLQNVTVQQQSPAENNGAVILNSGNIQNNPYQSLTLQFRVVATYDDFLRLLGDLESSLRIVDLVSLSVQPFSASGAITEEETEPLYTFGVALRTYWLK